MSILIRGQCHCLHPTEPGTAVADLTHQADIFQRICEPHISIFANIPCNFAITHNPSITPLYTSYLHYYLQLLTGKPKQSL